MFSEKKDQVFKQIEYCSDADQNKDTHHRSGQGAGGRGGAMELRVGYDPG